MLRHTVITVTIPLFDLSESERQTGHEDPQSDPSLHNVHIAASMSNTSAEKKSKHLKEERIVSHTRFMCPT